MTTTTVRENPSVIKISPCVFTIYIVSQHNENSKQAWADFNQTENSYPQNVQ